MKYEKFIIRISKRSEKISERNRRRKWHIFYVFLSESKNKWQMVYRGAKKRIFRYLKKINFNSKEELIEKIEPYFEEFAIKTDNFCYKLSSDVTSDTIIFGWQWKAL